MGKSKKKKKNSPAAQPPKKNHTGLLIAAAAALVAVLVLVVVLLSRSGGDSGLHHVEIDVADYGTIALELDGDTAPITVENFLKLAKSGFYDGLTFRGDVYKSQFQGGDPQGNGMGGSDETIKGEFSANGVENDISHVRGVISMARNGYDMDSASSQFFIVQSDSTFLDGQYAAFGHVTDGMEIVDAICKDPPVEDSNGTVLAENQPVITEVRVID